MGGMAFVCGLFTLSIVLYLPGFVILLLIRHTIGLKNFPSDAEIRFDLLNLWIGLFLGANIFGFNIYTMAVGIIFQTVPSYLLSINEKRVIKKIANATGTSEDTLEHAMNSSNRKDLQIIADLIKIIDSDAKDEDEKTEKEIKIRRLIHFLEIRR